MTIRLVPAARSLLLGALAAALLSAAPQSGPADRGAELLRTAVAALFNESTDRAQVRSVLDQAADAFRGVTDPALRAYWQARVLYVTGIVERGAGSPRDAQARFEESLRLARESLAARETSEAWRLSADNFAQLMLVNGILYTITTGGKVRTSAEKALGIDPDNAKAQLTLALYYLNAPGFAGGSVSRAAALLARLRERQDLEDEDRFAVRVWLAIASGKDKDTAAARRFLDEAAAVYPGNTWIRDIEKGLL
jgi:hypothetical protein